MNLLKEKLVSEHLLYHDGNHATVMDSYREQSLQAFEQLGFPHPRDEEWKYTNLREILSKDYKLQVKTDDTPQVNEVMPYLVHDIDSYNLVFVNGRFSSFLSSTTHDEADVCVMSSAMRKGMYQTVIESYYNKFARNDEHFVALNTAYAKDGAYIHIPRNTILSKPIQIIYFSTQASEDALYHTRNLVVVGENSQVRIIERHRTLNSQANLTNAVSEVYLGKNSQVDWYKVQNDDMAASLIDNTFVSQERDSTASFHTFSMAGNIIRNGLNFKQLGENCNSILKGISLGRDNMLIDHHTQVEHISPNCESHELYRTVLDDNSKGVFNGKVIVEPQAQKIDAFQQNNNILLSPECSIDTKPQLEIFADDVKCSHGCTVGQLDQEALFYLQSRGIPKKQARALMLYAFMTDVLDTVEIPELKTRIMDIMADRLALKLDF
ncbi:MAG: Fe-S cluster assembly protein SufD [Weeksellaceae bacterium]|nr:Fe-S cluster assembly protein SufD [Weeksellaceae bacterium]